MLDETIALLKLIIEFRSYEFDKLRHIFMNMYEVQDDEVWLMIRNAVC